MSRQENARGYFLRLKLQCDQQSLQQYIHGSKGYIFILDEKGSMIYHPQQQLIYGGLKEERIEDILASKGDFLETEEGEDSKLYTMSKSEKTGWTVVGASYVTELMKTIGRHRCCIFWQQQGF